MSTRAVRDRITSCVDLETLRQWLRRAAVASTAEDILTDG
ncbi:hypothetical protein QF026_004505 [Streptomyces aurantiacus]|nr:hypothetical protein [Streptomyces aurantiacus]